MSMEFELTGKTAIITGASSGVGEACARQFIAGGANVALAARSADTLAALAQELGPRALAVPCDVCVVEDCRRLVDACVAHFGKLEILVNNAGFNSRGGVASIGTADMERIIDVNLKAPMRLTKLALPHLQMTGGCIVNVASLAGRVPLDDEASYSASKFGLRGFSLALAEEMRGTGITVSLVSPGPIKTGFIMDDIDEVPDLVFSQPMSTAEEVAGAVLQCVRDGKLERAIPAVSGILAHVVYLFPALRRALKPVLESRGRQNKAKFRDPG